MDYLKKRKKRNSVSKMISDYLRTEAYPKTGFPEHNPHKRTRALTKTD